MARTRFLVTLALVLGTVFISLAGSAGSALAQPEVRRVATTGVDSGNCIVGACKTIAYAIGQASPGDTIHVFPGSYCAPFVINKDLTIIGTLGTSSAFGLSAPFVTAIDGATNTCSVNTTLVSVDSNVTASMQNIAVDCDNSGLSPTVNGGGIANNIGADLSLNNVELDLDITGGDGGGIWNAGTLDVANAAFAGNKAAGSGGAIANTASGTAFINNSSISPGSNVHCNLGFLGATPADGGGIYNAGSLTMTESSVDGNRAGMGGGIYDTGTGSVANLFDDEIVGNTARLVQSGQAPLGSGGGMYVNGGTASLTNVTVADDTGQFSGGLDVENGASVALLNASVVYNSELAPGGVGGITSGAGTTVRLEIRFSRITGRIVHGQSPRARGAAMSPKTTRVACQLPAINRTSPIRKSRMLTITAELRVPSTYRCPPLLWMPAAQPSERTLPIVLQRISVGSRDQCLVTRAPIKRSVRMPHP